MRLTAATALLCMTLAPHAIAQNVLMINANGPAAVTSKPRTVNMTLQMSLPAPEATSSMDMTRSMETANRALYDIINHECQVLTAALKGDCKLTRLSTGSNYNERGGYPIPFANRGNAGPVVGANANATFEIDPPPAAPVPPSATPAAPAPPAPASAAKP